MLSKYTVAYAAGSTKHLQTRHYGTDDPVACEEFLVDLLERGQRVCAIKHEGVDLPRHEFDQMIKTAGGILAAKHICVSLGIDTEQAHSRFATPS